MASGWDHEGVAAVLAVRVKQLEDENTRLRRKVGILQALIDRIVAVIRLDDVSSESKWRTHC